MPGIIFRYISKNLLVFFLGVLFVFVFVVFMGQFSKIFTYAMTFGADMLWVFNTMLYMLPDILVLSIPMAFQIAILMTLTNMSQTGEIMALRAAGLSFKEISRPIFITAVLVSGLMFFLTGYLSPSGRHSVEKAKEDIASKISKVNIEPKTFINIGDWDLFAEGVNKKQKTLTQVHLARKNDKTALSTKVNAAEGKIHIGSSGIELNLYKGQMQRVDSLETRKIVTAEFDRYSIFIPLTQKPEKQRNIKASELTTPQIIKELQDNSLPHKLLVEYRPEPIMRIALSLAPIIFFFLSCPVAFVTDKKAGRAGAMIFSIVFIFSYLGLLTVGGNIGQKTSLVWLAYGAPLLPVIVGGISSFYLWRKRLSN